MPGGAERGGLRMETPAKRLAPWGLALSMTLLFFAGIWATQYFRFENSDDILLVKGFLGYEGGVPSGFSAYVHPFFTRPLQWISMAVPGVAWFSWLQLFLLFWANVVLCKAFLQLSGKGFCGSLWGMGAGGMYLAVFSLFLSCRLNFTTTAALLGAASVAQLLRQAKAGMKRTPPGARVGASSCPLPCLPAPTACAAQRRCPLAFWAASLLVYGGVKEAARGAAFPRKALLLGLGVCLGVMASLPIARLAEARLLGLGNTALERRPTRLMDYQEEAFDLAGDGELQEIGWSRAELELVREWYFMDGNITTEALERLARLPGQGAGSGVLPPLLSAFGVVGAFFAAHSAYLFSGGLLLLLWAAAVWRALAGAEKEPPRAWGSLGAVVLALGMLLYLGMGGRFLGRAVDSVWLPAGAILLALALPRDRRKEASPCKRALAAALCVLCVGLAAGNFAVTWRQLKARPDQVSPMRQAQLEAYGLAHPDKLFLYTPNHLRETLLFPDTSRGVPHNLMIWGDWYCRTPSWYGQLARFGIDGPSFSARDFLRDQVVFVSASQELPPALLPYLREHREDVKAVLIDVAGDLHFFQFQ